MTQEQSKPKEVDLSNICYVISDWDGTISNSWPDYLSAFAKLMEEKFGVDPDKSKEYYNFTAGEALSNQIKEAAQKFAGATIEDTIELENQFWEYQKDLPAPPVINGALQALQDLKSKGYKIFVWSGTRSDILADRLVKTGLDKLVDFSIGNLPGSSTQVKGEGLFEEIAKNLGISADELRQKAVIIGDGLGDIKAGDQVRCPAIGIPKNPADKKLLENAGADFVIDSITDLPSLLIH